jgi:UDP-N-acetylmuramyl pentapeptide phosphotransferase/UDP-N-acetylglucosamine-1-phosphate transferase
LLAPLLVTAIPLYDTTVVVLKRLRNRAKIMEGDRNHISHRLNRLGLTPRSALATVAALQTGLAASALLLRDADATTGSIVILQASSVLIAATLLEARRDRFT